MNLYQIDEQLENLIDEETGEITDVEMFSNLVQQQENGLINLAKWSFSLKGECDAIGIEIKRLQALKSLKETKIERLKDFIKQYMLSHDMKKIESPIVKLSFRKSVSVQVEDEFYEECKRKGLDDKLYKTKVTVSPDKEAIKEWLKDNVSLYAYEVENQNLQIK